MPDNTDRSVTAEQAYEAAYRFVWQYYQREPESVGLGLLVVAMQPVTDHHKTNDPASWEDWLHCVEQTLSGDPVPRLPTT